MDWICPAITVLIVVFGFFTVVGHGIWVFLAWLFGSGRRCPTCQSRLTSGICLNCRAASQAAELEITTRQLRRLHYGGVLDHDTFQRVRKAIESDPARKTSSSPTAEDFQKLQLALKKPPEKKPVAEVHPTPFSAEGKPESAAEETVPSNQESAGPAQPEPNKPAPKRPFSEVLLAFMEEKNIRWGELVGGLLIIMGSSALVVSLWSQISAIPILQFFLFTAITAALFGVGLYTEHRWRLPTTSRGILIIASLLVPLNSLAIAAFSASTEAASPLALGGEILAAVVFLGLLYFAGRVIVPGWSGTVSLGVTLCCLAQFVIRRAAAAETDVLVLVALSLAPVVVFVICMALVIHRVQRAGSLTATIVNASFISLGIHAFAAVIPVGLLGFRSAVMADTISLFAPSIALYAIPALCLGIVLWQRLDVKEFAAFRTTGTSLAVAGAFQLVAAIAVAWPNPALMLPTAALTAIVLTTTAIWFAIPAAHILSAACLGIVSVIAFQLSSSSLAWWNTDANTLLSLVLTAKAGAVLAVPFLGYVVAGQVAVAGRAGHSKWLFLSAGLLAAVSILVQGLYGFGVAGDPSLLSVTWTLYGFTAVQAARLLKIPAPAWVGSWVLLGASVQLCKFSIGEDLLAMPILTALLLHATALLLAAPFLFTKTPSIRAVVVAGGLGSSTIFAILAAASVLTESAEWYALSQLALWLGALWLAVGLSQSNPGWFRAGQAAVHISVGLAIAGWADEQAWFSGSLSGAVSFAQYLALSQVALCLLWQLSRLTLTPRMQSTGRFRQALEIAWPVDFVVAAALPAVVTVFGFVAALPGIVSELSSKTVPLFADTQSCLRWESWLVLLLLIAVLCLWSSAKKQAWIGMLVSLFATALLSSSYWNDSTATASALTWICSTSLVLLSAGCWSLMGLKPSRDRIPAAVPHQAGLHGVPNLILALFIPAIILPVGYAFGSALSGRIPTGPTAGWFAGLPTYVVYLVPLGLAVFSLAGHAVKERSEPLAAMGGWLLSWTVAVVLLTQRAGTLSVLDWIEVLHWIMLSTGLYGWAWQLLLRLGWIDTAERPSLILLSYAVIPMALQAAGTAFAGAGIFLRPAEVLPWMVQLGSAAAWTGMLPLLALYAALASGGSGLRQKERWIIALAILFGTIPCTVGFWDTGDWASYHSLMIQAVLIAWAPVTLHWFHHRFSPLENGGRSEETLPLRYQQWAILAAIAGVILALRALAGDPQSPWWTISILALLAVQQVWVSIRSVRRVYLFIAANLVQLTASIWWIQSVTKPFDLDAASAIELLSFNALVAGLAGLAWLAVELRYAVGETAGRASDHQPRSWLRLPPVHLLNFIIACCILFAVTALKLALDANGFYINTDSVLTYAGWAAALGLVVASLWDRMLRHTPAWIYLLGLTLIGIVLDEFGLSRRWLGWTGSTLLAGYSVATSLIWSSRSRWTAALTRCGIAERNWQSGWLLAGNLCIVSTVLALSFWADWTISGTDRDFSPQLALGLRLALGKAAFSQVITLALLAVGERRTQLQWTTLMVGFVAAVAWGWAWQDPMSVQSHFIHRCVVLLTVSVGVILVYGLGLTKIIRKENDWTRATLQIMPVLIGVAAISTVLTLGGEAIAVASGNDLPIHDVAVAAVSTALGGAVFTLLAFAVLPGRDPLSLDEPGRMYYVYVAEACLGLLFLHIRLTKPEWFRGFFQQYWPFIVMAIAFCGVGLSELFRRQRRLVLAEPLERTGAFLPVLPVLGFWIASEANFSAVLFIVGLLYGVLSIARKSFGFGVLAAAAANGGIWYLLHGIEGLGLLQHPQLWLIPAALSVLVAAHLNRDHLDTNQTVSIRYICLMAIYVSSTADIFLNGVASSPWLPMVLAGLSVIGVFTGILLRIRSFMFLGSGFLVLSLITMILHAHLRLGWVWLWYVALVLLGLAILALFAAFEKKKQQLHQVLDGLKDWNS